MDYLALYWTLPVNWAGFTQLPKNPDDASKASRTIRYQVARVRRWVKDQKGTLMREVVFMDTRPDRGTDAIRSEIGTLLAEADRVSADLVLVNFSAVFGWRSHRPLFDMIGDARNCVLLDPVPELIDGKWWNPVDHFRAWREVDLAHQMAKDEAKDAALMAMTELKTEGISYAGIAAQLNAMGQRTVNGRLWTADNVRKFMGQF